MAVDTHSAWRRQHGVAQDIAKLATARAQQDHGREAGDERPLLLTPAEAEHLLPRLPSLVPRTRLAVATPRNQQLDAEKGLLRGNSLIDYEGLQDELPQYDPGTAREVDAAISAGMFKPRDGAYIPGHGRRHSLAISNGIADLMAPSKTNADVDDAVLKASEAANKALAGILGGASGKEDEDPPTTSGA